MNGKARVASSWETGVPRILVDSHNNEPDDKQAIENFVIIFIRKFPFKFKIFVMSGTNWDALKNRKYLKFMSHEVTRFD